MTSSWMLSWLVVACYFLLLPAGGGAAGRSSADREAAAAAAAAAFGERSGGELTSFLSHPSGLLGVHVDRLVRELQGVADRRFLQTANDPNTTNANNTVTANVTGEIRTACQDFENDTARLSEGLFSCACDDAGLSMTCETPVPVPVGGSSQLVTVQNFTLTFVYQTEDRYLAPRNWNLCYAYRYKAQPPPASVVPPQGCVEFVMDASASASASASAYECAATLTDPANGTLGNCTACRPCSPLKADVDCSNINPLAVSDNCYNMFPYRTFELFPDAVRSGGHTHCCRRRRTTTALGQLAVGLGLLVTMTEFVSFYGL